MNYPISFLLSYLDQLVKSFHLPRTNSENFDVCISTTCHTKLRPVLANRENFESINLNCLTVPPSTSIGLLQLQPQYLQHFIILYSANSLKTVRNMNQQ